MHAEQAQGAELLGQAADVGQLAGLEPLRHVREHRGGAHAPDGAADVLLLGAEQVIDPGGVAGVERGQSRAGHLLTLGPRAGEGKRSPGLGAPAPRGYRSVTMIALLSPAKSLDFDSRLPTRKSSQPRLLQDAERLIEVMRTKSPEEVAALMELSGELAELNVERYADFSTPFTRRNARAAVLAFNGDVYQGMNARERFDERDFTEAQKTIRILSGLFGLLRPLDLIQPYRLEMGVALATERGANLYQWWGEKVTDLVNADLAESPGAEVVVNLASAEYAKVVQPERLAGRLVSPRFEDADDAGRYRVVSFFAKRARGEMAAWMVHHRVRTPGALKKFDGAGYRFDARRSTAEVPVFVRDR